MSNGRETRMWVKLSIILYLLVVVLAVWLTTKEWTI